MNQTLNKIFAFIFVLITLLLVVQIVSFFPNSYNTNNQNVIKYSNDFSGLDKNTSSDLFS